MSHLVEHMLFKGTSKHDNQQLTTLIRDNFSNLNASTSGDYMAIRSYESNKKLKPALQISSEMLLDSVFPEEELKKEKEVVRQEIIRANDDINRIASLTLNTMAYNYPEIKSTTLGDEKKMMAIKRSQLLKYQKDNIIRENFVASVSSNLPAFVIKHYINKYFIDKITYNNAASIYDSSNTTNLIDDFIVRNMDFFYDQTICSADEEPFDAIVSNPPYSIPWDGSNDPTLINDPRFSPAGVLAPASKADLAFTMHMLSWLSTEGTAAIIEFPGVLYRGGKEKSIRQWLIENNRIDTIIQLPANLFFGVGIATCIIVLRKGMRPDNKVLFIDASREFVNSGNKNRLTTENQDHIFNVFAERKEEQYFSCLVPNSDILANDANLSVSSYVEQEDTREVIDIKAVNAKLVELIAEGEELNRKIDAIVKELGE